LSQALGEHLAGHALCGQQFAIDAAVGIAQRSITRSRISASSDCCFISGVSNAFALAVGICRRKRSTCSLCAMSHSAWVTDCPSIFTIAWLTPSLIFR
jgi:hypothetical protein